MRKRWKSVEKELPAEGLQVLIRCEGNSCWVGRLKGCEWWANGWGAITTKVTHWMYIVYPVEEL